MWSSSSNSSISSSSSSSSSSYSANSSSHTWSSPESKSNSQVLSSPESHWAYRSSSELNSSHSTLSDFSLDDPSGHRRRRDSVASHLSDYHLNLELLIPFSEINMSDAELGRGTFSIVYRATLNNEPVAVKQLKKPEGEKEVQLDSFLTEAKQIASLASGNIVKLKHICGEDLDPYCLVLELMEGGSLYDYLKNNAQISWLQRLQIAQDIVDGLIYLQCNNKIQCDLKTSNILLTTPDARGIRHAKLSDLNLVSLNYTNDEEDESPNTTIAWMAPELLEAEFKNMTIAKHTVKSSVYTLGWVLWSLLSHKTPFEFQELHSRDLEMLNKIINYIIEGIRADVPDVGAPLDYVNLVHQCWDQEPGLRPSFKEARTVLNGLKL